MFFYKKETNVIGLEIVIKNNLSCQFYIIMSYVITYERLMLASFCGFYYLVA